MGGDAEYPLVAHAEGQRPVYRSGSVHLRCTATSAACRIPTAIATCSGRSAATARCPCRSRLPKRDGRATRRRLYAYLRRTDGICTSHTSATDQGTDWAEHDDALEPVVEIFQGYAASSEAPGAPKAENDTMDRIHGPFKPDGFVSLALDKGYRLGFQASSDHISTHVSYACVVAEEFSRKGLIDAIKKRHTYAATDNIVLDVRMGRWGSWATRFIRTSRAWT